MLKMKMTSSILIICFLLAMHANLCIGARYFKRIMEIREGFLKCCKKIKCDFAKSREICVPIRAGPRPGCRCKIVPPENR